MFTLSSGALHPCFCFVLKDGKYLQVVFFVNSVFQILLRHSHSLQCSSYSNTAKALLLLQPHYFWPELKVAEKQQKHSCLQLIALLGYLERHVMFICNATPICNSLISFYPVLGVRKKRSNTLNTVKYMHWAVHYSPAQSYWFSRSARHLRTV